MQSLTNLLYLYPNQTVFTNISGQMPLCPSHYLYAANFTSGLNWAAKYWPALIKHTWKTNLQICVFCKNFAIVSLFKTSKHQFGPYMFNMAKLMEVFCTLDHYSCSPEYSCTCITNALRLDFPISLPIYLCVISLHKGKLILLHYTLMLDSCCKWLV